MTRVNDRPFRVVPHAVPTSPSAEFTTGGGLRHEELSQNTDRTSARSRQENGQFAGLAAPCCRRGRDIHGGVARFVSVWMDGGSTPSAAPTAATRPPMTGNATSMKTAPPRPSSTAQTE